MTYVISGDVASSNVDMFDKIEELDKLSKELDKRLTAAEISLMPVGAMFYHSSKTAPSNSVRANGGWLSKASYPELFAVIGYSYGNRNNGDEFALPNAWNRFIKDGGDRALGGYEGQSIQSHNHSYIIAPDRNGNPDGGWDSGGGKYYWRQGTTSTNTGSTGSSETRPNNYAFPMFIKYK